MTKKETITNLLKETLYNSFAQAIIKLVLSPHAVVKVSLLIFVLVASALASILVIQSFTFYFTYGVSTTSRTIPETPTLFPSVTFCNVNQMTTEYAFNLTQKGIANGNNLSNDDKKKLGHDLNDILFDCLFDGNLCDSQNFTWSYDTIFGNCYTFNSGDESTLRKSTIGGPDYGLQMRLYINFYEKLLDSANGLGAVIRIGNGSHSTYYLNSGIFISPGTISFVSVEREFKSMLSKPYSDCEIETNSAVFKSNYEYYNLIAKSYYSYSQQLCLAQCLQKESIRKFDCTLPLILSLYNNKSQCNSSVIETDYNIHKIFGVNFINQKCLPSCPLECNQALYKSSISTYQFIGSQYIDNITSNPKLGSDFVNRTIDSDRARDSFVLVYVFYDRLSYTLTYENPLMNIVSLLGWIGGILGLFLGVSVFSLFEMVEVVIEIIFILKEKTMIEPFDIGQTSN